MFVNKNLIHHKLNDVDGWHSISDGGKKYNFFVIIHNNFFPTPNFSSQWKRCSRIVKLPKSKCIWWCMATKETWNGGREREMINYHNYSNLILCDLTWCADYKLNISSYTHEKWFLKMSFSLFLADNEGISTYDDNDSLSVHFKW